MKIILSTLLSFFIGFAVDFHDISIIWYVVVNTTICVLKWSVAILLIFSFNFFVGIAEKKALQYTFFIFRKLKKWLINKNLLQDLVWSPILVNIWCYLYKNKPLNSSHFAKEKKTVHSLTSNYFLLKFENIFLTKYCNVVMNYFI
jgi:hypothetical protein